MAVLGQGVDLDGLRSDDPAMRHAAQENCKNLPESALREALALERDPEAAARLRAALRHAILGKSDELYRAGKLSDSLKRRLEADGVLNVDAEFNRRLAKAEEDLRTAIEPSPACELWSAKLATVHDRVKFHGRWSYPELLRALRGGGAVLAMEILKRLGPEIHPLIRAELKAGSDSQYAYSLVETLWAQRAWSELEALRDDASFNVRVRALAREFLDAR